MQKKHRSNQTKYIHAFKINEVKDCQYTTFERNARGKSNVAGAKKQQQKTFQFLHLTLNPDLFLLQDHFLPI